MGVGGDLVAASEPVSEPVSEPASKPASEPDVPPIAPRDSFEALGKDESVATYERKSISYLRMRAVANLPSDAYGVIERTVRKSVELPRFDYNDISHLSQLSPQDAAEVVTRYLDEIQLERARETAQFDMQFKDYTITGDDLRRIVSSAHLYQPEVYSFSAVRQRYVYYVDGRPRVGYRWISTVGVTVRFYSVDYHEGKAVEFATLRVSGRGSVTESGVHGSGRMAAIREAATRAGAELEKQVRGIDEFNLLTPITATSFNAVHFGLTRAEGLKLGQGFHVYDYYTDGTRSKVGYVRVKRVGDGKTELDSTARNIAVRRSWRFQEGQLLEEYPQLGVRVQPRAGLQHFRLEGAEPFGLRGDNTGFQVGVDAQYDISDQSGVPDLYAAVGLNLMFSEFLEIGVEAGLDKHFYLRRLVLIPGIRVGVLRAIWNFSQTGGTGLDPTASYQAESIGVTPRLGAEFWVTPDLSLGVQAGYRLYTPQSTLRNVLDSDDLVDLGSAGFSYRPSGLELLGGFSLSF